MHISNENVETVLWALLDFLFGKRNFSLVIPIIKETLRGNLKRVLKGNLIENTHPEKFDWSLLAVVILARLLSSVWPEWWGLVKHLGEV